MIRITLKNGEKLSFGKDHYGDYKCNHSMYFVKKEYTVRRKKIKEWVKPGLFSEAIPIKEEVDQTETRYVIHIPVSNIEYIKFEGGRRNGN